MSEGIIKDGQIRYKGVILGRGSQGLELYNGKKFKELDALMAEINAREAEILIKAEKMSWKPVYGGTSFADINVGDTFMYANYPFIVGKKLSSNLFFANNMVFGGKKEEEKYPIMWVDIEF